MHIGIMLGFCMPSRLVPLVTGEYYHVLNRGISDQPVFIDKRDYQRMMLGLSYYKFVNQSVRLSLFNTLNIDQRLSLWGELQRKDEKLVEIIAFSLMPSHFHLLLRQVIEGGVSTFIRRLTNSYTRYFNTRNERKGPIFQGAFKAVHISTDEQLLHVSRYIHLNPVVSFVIPETKLWTYPWTSIPEYFASASLSNPVPILSHFKTKNDYKNFILDQVDYGKKLEAIKHLSLE